MLLRRASSARNDARELRFSLAAGKGLRIRGQHRARQLIGNRQLLNPTRLGEHRRSPLSTIASFPSGNLPMARLRFRLIQVELRVDWFQERLQPIRAQRTDGDFAEAS